MRAESVPRWHRYAAVGLLLASLAGLSYYVFRDWESFRGFVLTEPIYVLWSGILLLLEYSVVARITQLLLRPLAVRLGIWEAIALSIATGFHSMVLPFRAGIATRAAYLKTRHSFSYADFVAMFSASYILMNLVASSMGTGILLYLQASRGLVGTLLLFTFLGILSSHIVIVLFSPSLSETKNAWVNRFVRAMNSWLVIKREGRLVLAVGSLSLCQVLLEAAMLFCQFRAFGIQVDFVQCAFLAVVGLLGLLIQLTPSGWGVNEALLAFSAQAIGIPAAQTLVSVLLGRAITLVLMLALGPTTSVALMKGLLVKKQA